MTYISPPPPHPLGQHRQMMEHELERRGLDWSGRPLPRRRPAETSADGESGLEDEEDR